MPEEGKESNQKCLFDAFACPDYNPPFKQYNDLC